MSSAPSNPRSPATARLSSREAFFAAFEELEVPARAPDPLVDWLDRFWPQVVNSPQGRAVLAADTEQWLQGLSDRFGLGVDVRHASSAELAHLYDVCVLALGTAVNKALSYPQLDLRAFYDDWPQPWVDYVQAVARGEQARARQLAEQLQPLSRHCAWPPGVFALKKDAQGLPLPTLIPARLRTHLPG